MFALTFKQKLVLSMMLVVSGITVALLWIAERKLQVAYETRFGQEFDYEFKLFNARQDARLGALKSNASELASRVRFISVLDAAVREPDEESAKILYQVIEDGAKMKGGAGWQGADFYRAYDPQGKMISSGGDELSRSIDEQLKRIDQAVAGNAATDVGYLQLKDPAGKHLVELLLTKVNDPEEEEPKGTLLFAVPFKLEARQGESLFGLWVEGKLQVEGLPDEIQTAIAGALQSMKSEDGRTELSLEGKPFSFFHRRLNRGSQLPPAYQVSLQPLEPLLAEKRDLRKKIAGAGLLALAAALGLSLVLAGGLTAPIERLSKGAREIEQGNFDLKLPIRTADEIGRLTQSFNEMAAGLLLREKFRSVLDMVADKKIAHDLMNGQIELGGEERQVSVIFCDIRGFTALSEKMEPKEVIQMLNEHFTPLTRIVYEHHGAVDKFVGDLIMAIFGAPKGFGNDVENAARCAVQMIEERAALNLSGRYNIKIGIGVASGKVVAGRMGSKDRLNYTVLGPRVNLASRLCGQAAPMEVVIDEETWRCIEGFAQATPTPELRLKGFAAPVQAYKLEKIFTRNETEKNQPVAV